MKSKLPLVRYWTREDNMNDCLRNGSFIRRSKNGLAQFMNGDFMGFIDKVPDGMTEIGDVHAYSLIPQCCR